MIPVIALPSPSVLPLPLPREGDDDDAFRRLMEDAPPPDDPPPQAATLAGPVPPLSLPPPPQPDWQAWGGIAGTAPPEVAQAGLAPGGEPPPLPPEGEADDGPLRRLEGAPPPRAPMPLVVVPVFPGARPPLPDWQAPGGIAGIAPPDVAPTDPPSRTSPPPLPREAEDGGLARLRDDAAPPPSQDDPKPELVAPPSPAHPPPPLSLPSPPTWPAWWGLSTDAPPEAAPDAKLPPEGNGLSVRRLGTAEAAGDPLALVEAAGPEPAAGMPHEAAEPDRADAAPDESAALTVAERATGPAAAPVIPAVLRSPATSEPATPRADGGPLIETLRRALATSPPDQRPVELSFAAPELGAVRLIMRGRGRVVSVAIAAERGDTLALLQTHVESLVRDLNELGYSQATVSFAISGADAGSGQGGMTDAPPGPPDGPVPPPADGQHPDPALQPGPAQGWRDGLDLRL